jgi:hypothetical protein
MEQQFGKLPAALLNDCLGAKILRENSTNSELKILRLKTKYFGQPCLFASNVVTISIAHRAADYSS